MTELKIKSVSKRDIMGLHDSAVQIVCSPGSPEEETICYVERKEDPQIFVPKMTSVEKLRAALALIPN